MDQPPADPPCTPEDNGTFVCRSCGDRFPRYYANLWRPDVCVECSEPRLLGHRRELPLLPKK